MTVQQFILLCPHDLPCIITVTNIEENPSLMGHAHVMVCQHGYKLYLLQTPTGVTCWKGLSQWVSSRRNIFHLSDQEPKVVFVYHAVSQKATNQVHDNCQIELSPTLQRMLGMHVAYLSHGSHRGVHVVDVNQGFYSLYVYCNLIEPWM